MKRPALQDNLQPNDPMSTPRFLNFFVCSVLCLMVWSCSSSQEARTETAGEAEVETEAAFTDLLAGNTLDAWRNFKQDTISDKWQVTDGVLVLNEKGGGDIITREMYESFELQLEWKISENGNSNIKRRGCDHLKSTSPLH